MKCVKAFWNSPESMPVSRHVPLDIQDATIDQMMDPSKASPEEIEAIKVMHPKFVACRKSYIENLRTMVPSVAIIMLEYYQRDDEAEIDLIQQKISWGQYLKSGKLRVLEFTNMTTQENERIMNQLNTLHDMELSHHQAALNAIMQYNQTQQAINAIMQPKVNTSTCTGVGNTVNCVGITGR